jgi:hypothetical protein
MDEMGMMVDGREAATGNLKAEAEASNRFELIDSMAST